MEVDISESSALETDLVEANFRRPTDIDASRSDEIHV